MTFPPLETSRDGGRPRELYQFTRVAKGLQAGAVWFSNLQQYADTAALLAAWPETSDPTNQATWTLDDTLKTLRGQPAARIDLVGPISAGEIYQITHPVTGLEPDTAYDFKRRIFATAGAPFPSGAWFDATTPVMTDGSGSVDVYFRIVIISGGTANWTWWFDHGRLVRAAAADVTTVSRYTSAAQALVVGGETWYPSPIVRERIPHGSREAAGGDLILTVPRDHEIALAALDEPGRIQLVLSRVHQDALADPRVRFRGECVRVEPEGGEARLTFRPFAGTLDVVLPRFAVGRRCPFVTYDQHTCGVAREDFSMADAEVTVIDGHNVTVAGSGAFAADDPSYFAGGVLQLPSGATIPIRGAQGDVLDLHGPPTGLLVGDLVVLTAGDDHTAATCRDRFHNILRFGGSTKLPVRTPFRGAGLS